MITCDAARTCGQQAGHLSVRHDLDSGTAGSLRVGETRDRPDVFAPSPWGPRVSTARCHPDMLRQSDAAEYAARSRFFMVSLSRHAVSSRTLSLSGRWDATSGVMLRQARYDRWERRLR